MVYAVDLKSIASACGFESHRRHFQEPARDGRFPSVSNGYRHFPNSLQITAITGRTWAKCGRGSPDHWQSEALARPPFPGTILLLVAKHDPVKPQATVAPDFEDMATKTIRGVYGNDPARRQALGDAYDTVMAIVNRRLGGSTGASAAANCGGVCVTVRGGDTLSAIAVRNGGTWDQYTGYRSGNPALIYPGETVCRRTGPTATTANAGGGRYVVRAGDTLGGIAAYYGVNMYGIHGYRSGNPALIYPGETLYW